MSVTTTAGSVSLSQKKRSLQFRNDIKGYMFMAPFLVLFTVFTLLPVIIAFTLSLTSYNMIDAPKFIGLRNYISLLMDDDIFIIAVKNTLLFAVISGPIGFFMSFVMAWVIDGMRFKKTLSLLFYAPSITSSVAMAVVWLYLFSSDRYGAINNVLINLGIISEPILWTTNPKTILSVVMVISVWMSMGNGFLTFLAGLKNISASYYEAARIDGIQNRFQELFYITLPQMKPQMLFGSINAMVAALGVFDIAVSVAGMPSPNYAAHTIVAHLYDHAFIRFDMGYASAIAMVLFIFSFAVGQLLMKVFSSKDV